MATWFYRSGASGSGAGTDWANARTTLQTITGVVAGDTLYVADDHSETVAANFTMILPGTAKAPCYIICADHTKASPGATDWRTTAVIATTANYYIYIAGSFYLYGMTLQVGAGASSGASAMTLGGTIADFVFLENCALKMLNTYNSASSVVTYYGYTVMKNTSLTFSSPLQGIRATSYLLWRDTAVPLLGTIPASVFQGGSLSLIVELENLDLSAMSGSNSIWVPSQSGSGITISMRNCRLSSTGILAGSQVLPGRSLIVTNCDYAATNYRQERYAFEGIQTVETTVVRTSGASDGVTAISWRITTTANAIWLNPYASFPIDQWNTTTGSNVTAIVRGITDAAVLPNNDDIWTEVSYLGNASYPLGSTVRNTKASLTSDSAAVTADTSSWDSAAPARQNNHAYVLGNVIKLSSNPGRVFFCTTAGTTAGSEPGGYASAVDGGSVTDSGAVFRAGVRFQLGLALSSPQPALAGSLNLTVKAAKASTTWFIDPMINSS